MRVTNVNHGHPTIDPAALSPLPTPANLEAHKNRGGTPQANYNVLLISECGEAFVAHLARTNCSIGADVAVREKTLHRKSFNRNNTHTHKTKHARNIPRFIPDATSLALREVWGPMEDSRDIARLQIGHRGEGWISPAFSSVSRHINQKQC